MRQVLTFLLAFSCATANAQIKAITLRLTAIDVTPPHAKENKFVVAKKGDTITVIRYSPDTKKWYAEYQKNKGYIDDADIAYSDELSSYMNKFLRTPEQDYKRNIKKYGLKYAKYIKDKTVVIGMPKSIAKIILGQPSEINKTVNGSGVREQWVYQNGDSKSEFYYFENGKLTAWQD